MTLQPETVRELTIAGAGAVVLPSILEEQIVREMIQHGHRPSFEERQVEAEGSAKLEDVYNGGVHGYLQTLGMLKKCTGVPIIANLNGCDHGRWLEFASRLEAAGADAIELSIHLAGRKSFRKWSAFWPPLLQPTLQVRTLVWMGEL